MTQLPTVYTCPISALQLRLFVIICFISHRPINCRLVNCRSVCSYSPCIIIQDLFKYLISRELSTYQHSDLSSCRLLFVITHLHIAHILAICYFLAVQLSICRTCSVFTYSASDLKISNTDI